MTSQSKPNAARIKSFIAELKRKDWLGSARGWWPDHLFHVTDIQNAVSILREETLLSHHQATERGLMVTDNASHNVIGETEDEWKDYVRLYFRPRTPTHYRSEGFRPGNQRELNSHCPVPICFLFDSYSILSQEGTRFSDGNLASNPRVYTRSEDLGRRPFEHVYHDSAVSPDERPTIVFHRNAEVIVPINSTSPHFSSSLAEANQSTKPYFISSRPGASCAGTGRIGLGRRMNLFHKRWTYVETATLETTHVSLQFHRLLTNARPIQRRA